MPERASVGYIEAPVHYYGEAHLSVACHGMQQEQKREGTNWADLCNVLVEEVNGAEYLGKGMNISIHLYPTFLACFSDQREGWRTRGRPIMRRTYLNSDHHRTSNPTRQRLLDDHLGCRHPCTSRWSAVTAGGTLSVMVRGERLNLKR